MKFLRKRNLGNAICQVIQLQFSKLGQDLYINGRSTPWNYILKDFYLGGTLEVHNIVSSKTSNLFDISIDY